MHEGLSDEQVVVRGPLRTVAYAIDVDGNMHARDFLAQKYRPKKCPTSRELAGFDQLFKMMTTQGEIKNVEHFRKERGKIYGFKKYQSRLAAFQVGGVWYLTHGFKKKSPKWPSSEIEKAERIRNEHLSKTRAQR